MNKKILFLVLILGVAFLPKNAFASNVVDGFLNGATGIDKGAEYSSLVEFEHPLEFVEDVSDGWKNLKLKHSKLKLSYTNHLKEKLSRTTDVWSESSIFNSFEHYLSYSIPETDEKNGGVGALLYNGCAIIGNGDTNKYSDDTCFHYYYIFWNGDVFLDKYEDDGRSFYQLLAPKGTVETLSTVSVVNGNVNKYPAYSSFYRRKQTPIEEFQGSMDSAKFGIPFNSSFINETNRKDYVRIDTMFLYSDIIENGNQTKVNTDMVDSFGNSVLNSNFSYSSPYMYDSNFVPRSLSDLLKAVPNFLGSFSASISLVGVLFTSLLGSFPPFVVVGLYSVFGMGVLILLFKILL